MRPSDFKNIIKSYPDFPKKGILFRDVMPILSDPQAFSDLIDQMATSSLFDTADAILAIDARGFLFGSPLAIKLSKPLVVARKAGKLPGDLLSATYQLEYGSASLSVQKNAINKYDRYVIVDDLLATGGTVNCVSELLRSFNKEIAGLFVVVELLQLQGRSCLPFPVESVVTY